MTYTLQTKLLDEDTLQITQVARLRSILYLRPHLRLIQGLQWVPHSPLRDLIINAQIDEMQLEPVDKASIFKYQLVTKVSIKSY